MTQQANKLIEDADIEKLQLELIEIFLKHQNVLETLHDKDVNHCKNEVEKSIVNAEYDFLQNFIKNNKKI